MIAKVPDTLLASELTEVSTLAARVMSFRPLSANATPTVALLLISAVSITLCALVLALAPLISVTGNVSRVTVPFASSLSQY